MKDILRFIVNRLSEIDINYNHPKNCKCKLCTDYNYIKNLIDKMED